ncbi:MAG TPA: histone deacetylase [Terriglobia bacterium]|jgi:acetoin utilization deacetylase AcuC-like enzyme|nr:histone deacetylase [Terriglobia bacterium]
MNIVYSDGYDLHLGDHIFPSIKYRLTKEKLLKEGWARAEDFIEPEPASDEDVALVHDLEYIYKLKAGSLSYTEILRLEVPYSPELVQAVWLSAGGSILAARLALQAGAAVNLGGGFHHAFADHGEGFCVLHDVAIAIRRLQKDGAIHTAMTVDCDVHHGNGTADIFAADPDIFTFSIHQVHNYPYPKPPSSLDIDLDDGAGDDEYLAALEDGLEKSFAAFQPDLVFYLAGADPYRDDQLGGLKLSLEGLEHRDRLVFEQARKRKVPVAVALAGGYARHLQDTVRIHATTARVAQEFAGTARPAAT